METHSQQNHGIEQQPAANPVPVPEKNATTYPPNDAAPPPAYEEGSRSAQPAPAGANPYPVQQPMSNAAPPVTPLERLGDYEAWIDCPFCHRRTRTRVDKVDSSMTMVLGLLLCLICICAAIIPCIAHWCADIDHYCSECNKRVTHRPYNGQVQVLCEQGGMPYTTPSRYAQAGNMENGTAHRKPPGQ